MKCTECGKALKQYAAQVMTPGGDVIGWGPKCARKAFKVARRSARLRRPMPADYVDPLQMRLELEAA